MKTAPKSAPSSDANRRALLLISLIKINKIIRLK